MGTRVWAAVGSFAVVLAGCSGGADSEPVRINGATMEGTADLELTLGLDACEATCTVESVRESSGEVAILVHRSPEQKTNPNLRARTPSRSSSPHPSPAVD